MRGIPLSLKTEDMFNKIVSRKRGGYCFELNGLFSWLLRSLGFEVQEYMAKFLRGEKEIPTLLRVARWRSVYLLYQRN